MFVDTKLWLISNFSSFIANAIRTCRCNYSWFHMPLLTTLQSSLANWVLRSSQYNCKLGNQIANFETYLSTLVLLNFITSYIFLKPGNCNIMNPNPFTKQGKGYRVRPVKWFTADKWLEGSKPFQVVHQFNLSKKTVTNIVDQFVHTERSYKYSMYTTEIQKQFIKNWVIDPKRLLVAISILDI